MKKRLLASLMSLCLIVGLLPTAAFAAEPDTTEEAPQAVVCEVTPGCTLEDRHEGNCAVAPAEGNDVDSADVNEYEPDYTVNENSPVVTNTSNAGQMDYDSDGDGNLDSWKLSDTNSTGAVYAYLTDEGTVLHIAATKDSDGRTVDSINDTAWNQVEEKSAIEKVVVEEGVTYLGSNLTRNLGCVEIELPATLTEVVDGDTSSTAATFGNNAISESGSYGIEKITVADGNTSFKVVDGVLFTMDGTTLIKYTNEADADYTVPAGVTTVAAKAFARTSHLTSATMNKGLQKILGDCFDNTNNLKSVVISSTVTTMGNGLFTASSIETLYINSAILEQCGTLGNADTELKTVYLAEGTTKIFDKMFRSMSALETVYIPASVESIGFEAFSGCTSLKTVAAERVVFDALERFEANSSGASNAFSGCTALTAFPLTADTPLEKLSKGVFSGCSALTSIVIPDATETISENAFYDCSALETVSFGENLEKIESNAFWDAGIKSIEIDSPIAEIANRAFGSIEDIERLSISADGDLTLKDGIFDNSTASEAIETVSIGSKNGTVTIEAGSLLSGPNIQSVKFFGKVSVAEHLFSCSGVTNSKWHTLDLTEIDTITCFNTDENNPGFIWYLGTLNYSSSDKTNGVIYVSDATKKDALDQRALKDNKRKYIGAVTNGGTFEPDPQFTAGSLATLIKDGYKFEGWYSKNGEDDDWGTQVSSNLQAGSTYYAKWTKSENYSISDDDKKVSLEMTYGEQAASKTITVSGPQESPSITKVTSSSEAIKADYEGISVTVKAADNLDAGTYTGTVYVYTGDGATHWIEVTLTVERADSSVTPSEGSGNIEATYGETITFVAEVAKAENSIAAITNEAEQNRVAFYCGDTLLGTAVVIYSDDTHTTGTAKLNYDTFKGGIPAGSAQTVTAYYGGSINLNGSSTDSIQVTLSKIKSSVSISADPSTMTGAGTVTLTVDKSGLPEGATVSVTCDNATYNPAENGNGTYTVTLPNSTATYQFTVTYAGDDTHAGATADCTVSVTRSGGSGSGSGSGSTTYAITVESSRHGEVDSNCTRASSGSTVTLTVTPDEGYVLDALTVTDKNGDMVKLTDKGNGKYTFKMPRSAVTVEASFVAEADPDIPVFTDVPADAYYADAVSWAVENGITNGTSATTFGPDVSCTRAQMVTFLWRAAGSPEPTTANNPFTDVQAGSYYYDAVLWAVEQGITNGTSATTFSPDATVTRGQTVTFLWRANGSPAVSGGSFSDVAADAYYADAVAWAVSEGITNGTSSTTFSPDMNCTRAQIVTFMYRDMAD